MRAEPKTALITGASSGIGREVAIWFAKRGVRVYAAARRTAMLEALAAGGHGTIIPFALDVSREAETVAAIEKLDDDCGGLDLVLANAGLGDATPADQATWAQVEKILKVNVMGAAATLTAVLPRMVKRGHGRVAGISSIAARRGLGGYSCYSASKAFVSSFLESIRVDLHGTGVTATCIEPGFVKTEINEHFVGITPMPFRMEAARAAEKVGRAILAGKRVLSFPWQLALGSGLLGVVPDAIYEPLGKRVLVTQTRLLAARAAGK